MSKDDIVYIGHMLDMSLQALELSARLEKDAFDQDTTLRLALTHLVQVIGEAARQVSENFKKDHPEIPWNEVIGMRHRIVHDYLNVDADIVWQVVIGDLPDLVSGLKDILPEDFE
jgi:uncharacterized protein with HEPN domain